MGYNVFIPQFFTWLIYHSKISKLHTGFLRYTLVYDLHWSSIYLGKTSYLTNLKWGHLGMTPDPDSRVWSKWCHYNLPRYIQINIYIYQINRSEIGVVLTHFAIGTPFYVVNETHLQVDGLPWHVRWPDTSKNPQRLSESIANIYPTSVSWSANN